MECNRVERLLDAYAAGELAADKAEAIRAHVTQCANCAVLAKEYERARSALAKASADAVKPGGAFFMRLSARLDEVDRRKGRMRRPAVRWHFVGAVATAAAAVFILSVYVLPNLGGGTGTDMPAGPVVANGGTDVAPESAGGMTYLPVSAGGQYWPGDSQNYPVGYNTGPRLTFPQYPARMDGMFASEPTVPMSQYRRLEARIKELEARIASLEQEKTGNAK